MAGSDRPPQPIDEGQQLYLRRASGVVRAMSPVDGMFYGYLSATGIYVFVFYLFLGAAAFPRANFWLANLISFVFFFFVFAVYAMLGATMPRSGGDYVFVSRILHPNLGFTASMAGWTLWQFFGCFFAASALINVVLRPSFSLIGVASGHRGWVTAGDYVGKHYVHLPLVILMIVAAGWIASNGMPWYVKIQKYFMFPAAFLGLLMIIGSLLFVSHSTFIDHLNQFQQTTGGISSDKVISTAQSLGFHPKAGYSVEDTIGMAVNFAYVYVWIMWSIELFGEMKSARRVRSVFGMFSGAHILMFLTVMVGIIWTYHYVGRDLMRSFAWMVLNNPDKLGGSWDFRGATTFFYLPVLNLAFGIILFLCFVGPISQSLFNTILGGSRLLLAASFDRVLPSWLGRVNRKGVPYISIWLGVTFSIAVAAAFEFTTKLAELLFWSTFMTLLAMLCTMVAGTTLPWLRRSIYEVSPASSYTVLGLPAITVCGAIATAFIAGTCVATLSLPAFGLLNAGPARASLITAVVVTVASSIGFEIAKRYRRSQGLEITAAFQEIPPA
jgi:amino acid transporter